MSESTQCGDKPPTKRPHRRTQPNVHVQVQLILQLADGTQQPIGVTATVRPTEAAASEPVPPVVVPPSNAQQDPPFQPPVADVDPPGPAPVKVPPDMPVKTTWYSTVHIDHVLRRIGLVTGDDINKLWDVWKAWYWILLLASPDLYNMAVTSHLIDAAHTPVLMSRFINIAGFLGMASKLLKVKHSGGQVSD